MPAWFDHLVRWLSPLPVCPEVEAGMGVPREPIFLVRTPQTTAAGSAPHIVVVGRHTGRDVTEAIDLAGDRIVRSLVETRIHGYIFKQRSPSCGPDDVEVWSEDGQLVGKEAGRLVTAVRAALPTLPVVGDETLADDEGRHHFLVRVYAEADLAALPADRLPAASERMAFHRRYKLALLACAEGQYRRLGPALAHLDDLAGWRKYVHEVRSALAVRPSRGSHVNALQHACGHFKQAPRARREALAGLVERYGRGETALSNVLSQLAEEAARQSGTAWVAAQRYLAFSSAPTAITG